MSTLNEFRVHRERMNKRILDQKSLVTNRFFSLDTKTYEPGALDTKAKELAGLAASMVLRCDDCIAYHTVRCKEIGCTTAEIWEIFEVGLVVGGSIVIPHMRRAVALLDELDGLEARSADPPE